MQNYNTNKNESIKGNSHVPLLQPPTTRQQVVFATILKYRIEMDAENQMVVQRLQSDEEMTNMNPTQKS